MHAVALTKDGRRAVTASDDLLGRCFDLTTGECTTTLEGHSGWVTDVKISPNGRTAVTASHDADARCAAPLICYCAMPFLERQHDRVHAAAGYKQARLCNSVPRATPFKLVKVGIVSLCRVWSLEDGKCLRVLAGHAGRLNKVALAGDGSVAVTASDDGSARVWRLSDGACLHVRSLSGKSLQKVPLRECRRQLRLESPSSRLDEAVQVSTRH